MKNGSVWIVLLLLMPKMLPAKQSPAQKGLAASTNISITYIDSLYKAAYQYELDGFIDSANLLANQCITLSNQINYKKGVLEGQKIIAGCIKMTGNTAQEVQLKLKQKNVNYLFAFSMLSIVAIGFLFGLHINNKKIVAQLKHANKELDNRNKHLLLYDRSINSDLITPIALIYECAQLLKGPNTMDDDLKQLMAKTISSEAEKVIEQVEELLKMGVEEPYSYISETSLYFKLLNDAVKLVKLKAESLDVQCIDSLPLIYMDQEGLKEIFRLILNNAVEHAGMGDALKIKVKGRYETGGKYCYIDISDNGKGISPDNLDKVFDIKFSIGDNKSSGLGLAICSAILQKNRGSITCSSKEGEGTTFTLSFFVDNTNAIKMKDGSRSEKGKKLASA